jgi:uncharacterized small protein (DUF1192 family)
MPADLRSRNCPPASRSGPSSPWAARSPVGSCSVSCSSALPASPGQNQHFAAAVSEVSDRVSVLVREEIALAKAEVTTKVTSIAKGAAAVGAGAVFGIFAVIFGLETLAWGLDAILVDGAGSLWIGFAIVFVVLLALALFAFLFAWRKLKVGAPAPTMAIEEAKRIRETVSAKSGDGA